MVIKKETKDELTKRFNSKSTSPCAFKASGRRSPQVY